MENPNIDIMEKTQAGAEVFVRVCVDPWLTTNPVAKMLKYTSHPQVGQSRVGKRACREGRAVQSMGSGVRQTWVCI